MKQYIDNLNRQLATGRAGEHTYRPALEGLLRRMLPADCLPSNEPARIECGAPDFIITRGGVPVSYIECKDLDDTDLDGRRAKGGHKEQFDRYKAALGTVAFTDYLDFHLYRCGELVMQVRIGEVKTTRNAQCVIRNCGGAAAFAQLIAELANAQPQPCKTAEELAGIMASKARLMRDVIVRSFGGDGGGALEAQYKAFRETLIKDLTAEQFADIYSQTLAYGLFAARLHLDDGKSAGGHTAGGHTARPYSATMRTVRGGAGFCRETAAFLIPPTNPLLQQVFASISGPALDARVAWVVDSLAEAFAATDAAGLMNGYAAKGLDPMVHFYEDFLSAYDPATRKQRGVWYTPPAVVRYIVRAADEALVRHFGIQRGLADSSIIRNAQCVMRNSEHIETEETRGKGDIRAKEHIETEETRGKGKKANTGVGRANDYSPLQNGTNYRVQILDPATGTGTFLVEVIRKIKEKFYAPTVGAGRVPAQEFQAGLWEAYAAQNLLPRVTGFEVLMASYAIAHLKVEQELAGVTPAAGQRTQIFLTNSLEEGGKENPNLFAYWLAEEAKAANRIKNGGRVMVLVGNPPYNISSANKNEWIEGLIADYKKDLNERRQNIDDDYVRFIRLGQYYIEQNGEGVLAYICNNTFLDGRTHRVMRKCLLNAFDDIYILNLHGNARKKETAPDGGKDENVFDIMAGVSINVFVKHGAQQTVVGANNYSPQENAGDNDRANDYSPLQCARVHYADLYGARKEKYEFLEGHGLGDTAWVEVAPQEPYYFFVPKDFTQQEDYEKGILLTDLFCEYISGIVTKRDRVVTFFNQDELKERLNEYKTTSVSALAEKYDFKDTGDWEPNKAMQDVRTNPIVCDKMLYRPFDVRACIYTGKKGIIARPRYDVMRHMLSGDNLALLVSRQLSTFPFQHALVSDCISDMCALSAQTKESSFHFPLWLAPDEVCLIGGERRANLRGEAVARFAEAVGREVSPEEVMQYVYGVLYSPEYRKKYNEFLKVDFPRIPLPAGAGDFEGKTALGKRLIELHLMRFEGTGGMTYPERGDNVVGSVRFEGDRVYINERQCFGGVTKEVWEYWIGGYQPMQKWLKDRKGRVLTFGDIEHYMRIGAAIGGTIEAVRKPR